MAYMVPLGRPTLDVPLGYSQAPPNTAIRDLSALSAGPGMLHEADPPAPEEDAETSSALQVLSVRAIALLQQYQGLDQDQQDQEDKHGELARMAFQFRRRKAAILQGFIRSQCLLQTLATAG